MICKIYIECDDENEIYSHLSVIRSQLKKEFKKNDKKLMEGKREKAKLKVDDVNCYGTHEVIVHINK